MLALLLRVILIVTTILTVSTYFLAFPLRGSAFADKLACYWSKSLMWCLRKICGISYQVLNAEKIPNEPCIIACKHQSMWETVVMHLICKRPAYVYKKELTKVPFYGWFLGSMTGIKVDRDGGASALKDLIRQTKKYLSEGHNVIIFPQGTRSPVGATTAEYPYQAGIAALYMSCNVKVVPAALNSGLFWNKKTVIKKHGVITIDFLEPIEPGLSKQEFMKKLEEVIEKRSLELEHYPTES